MTIFTPYPSADSWIEDVARAAGIDDLDQVQAVLEEGQVPGRRVLPARRNLRVLAMHFSGVKDLPVNSGGRNFVPFSFSREFLTNLTAIASDGKNDAGKSSVIDVVNWALKGRSPLQSDVQNWISQACVLLQVGTERVLVGWDVFEGAPYGQVLSLATDCTLDWEDLNERALMACTTSAEALTANPDMSREDLHAAHPASVSDELVRLVRQQSSEIALFMGAQQFAESMDTVMMQRLGFDKVSTWTANRGKSEELDDGKVTTHSWPAWSQALGIANPSKVSVLGDEPFLAAPILQTYLGSSWGSAASAASTRKKALEGQVHGIRRRQKRDAAAREEGAGALREEVARVKAVLAQFPDATRPEVVHALFAETVARNTDRAIANQRVQDAAAAYGRLERDLQEAQADRHALAEAAITKRFWHSLKPSCCPRCDAKVDQAKWQREQEGSCSLCNEPIETPAESQAATPAVVHDASAARSQAETAVAVEPWPADDSAPTEDDADDLGLVDQAITQLTAEVDQASALHDDVLRIRQQAELAHNEALARLEALGGVPEKRAALQRELDVLVGRLEERLNPGAEDALTDVDDQAVRILDAAEKLAKQRRADEQKTLLADVSEQVTILGRELGIDQLEKATLQARAHLPVVKGGAPQNFGKLTEGERLRLKIAVVIALIRVGTSAGVRRHPGLLVIDSLGREELNPENLERLLKELDSVAAQHDVQIITSSASGDVVKRVLAPESIVTAREDGYMW